MHRNRIVHKQLADDGHMIAQDSIEATAWVLNVVPGIVSTGCFIQL